MSSEKSKALQFYLSHIKSYSDKIPYFRKVLKYLWMISWKISLKLKSIKLSIDLEKIYWVSPNAIKYTRKEAYHNVLPYYQFKHIEKILIKDWDLPPNIVKVDEYKSYKTLYAHFIEGKEWKDTDFYKIELNRIKNGMIRWGCCSEREFKERFKKLDELYNDIKNNGFKTQKMLGMKRILKHKGIREIEDEISIAISRHGDLVRDDAQHRFAIAKILNIDRIPIQILFRHEKWMEFRKKIFYHIRREMAGKALQPLLHPDLSDIPSFWSDKRFKMIKQNLTTKKGTLLDIGAHWGYFCHKFEELGFQCTAMEGSMRNVYFMKKLKRAERSNFNIISKSIFDYKDCKNFEDDLNYDVVLALNLFNQFTDIEKKDLCSKFAEIFGKIKAKEMYFQIPEYEVIQKLEKTAEYKNRKFSSQELIDFVINNTHFTHAEKIGEERNHRIYKLTKRNIDESKEDKEIKRGRYLC